MPLDPLTRRLQRAVRNGSTITEAATKQGLTYKAAYRRVSGSRFRENLGRYVQSIGLRKLRNARNLTELIAREVERMRREPKPLTALDVKNLTWAAQAELESSRGILGSQIQRGQEEFDPELLRAYEQAFGRPLLKQDSETSQDKADEIM